MQHTRRNCAARAAAAAQAATLMMTAGLAPGAASAVEFELDEHNEFAVYVEFQYLYLGSERRLSDADESFDEAPPSRSGDETVEAFSELVDNSSLLGLEGVHTADNGVTAYFLVEWEFAADEDVGGLDTTSDSYIGIAGEFGEVRLGNWDGIYDELIADAVDAFEYEGLSEFNDTADAGDQVTYFSRDFDGFSVAVETLIKGDGAGLDTDDDGKADVVHPLIVVASYEAESVSVHLAYDDRALLGDEAEAQVGAAALFDLDPFAIGLKFEQAGASSDLADDGLQAWGALGAWDYGAGALALAVQRISYDEEIADAREDRTEYALHANYRLSEQVYFYVEGAWFGRFDDHGDYAGVGAVLEF